MAGQPIENESARRTAGLVLGGLAVGAALGAGLATEPALTTDGVPTVVVDAVAALTPDGGRSFQEQFRAAFTPGLLAVLTHSSAIIIQGGGEQQ